MTTITLDITEFRALFDAFSDETRYPDSRLQSYWTQATCYVSDSSSCDRLRAGCRELAIQLMMAHLLTLADGITNGTPSGQITSASEDGVSVGITPPTSRNQWQYWLNITPYGQRLLALLSSAYVGGLYVGGSRERQGFRKYGSRF